MQYGFRPKVGTIESIISLKTILANRIDTKKNTYLCFIDFVKAFDRVEHDKLIKVLKEREVCAMDRKIIADIYRRQKAFMLEDKEKKYPISIKRGVRQGCILSPVLFNTYADEMMKKADMNGGVTVYENKTINKIAYADDTVLIAENARVLEQMLNEVVKEGRKWSIEINKDKTKVMMVTNNKQQEQEDINIKLDGVGIQQVDKFQYLGVFIDNKLDHKSHVPLKMKVKMLKSLIFSLVRYGSEAFALTKTLKKKITSLEFWCYRRILRISWTDMTTNTEVLQRMGLQETFLLQSILKRKASFFGHIARGSAGEELRMIVGEGWRKVGRGRRRRRWMDDLELVTGTRDINMSNFKIEDELKDIRDHCVNHIEGSEVIACLPAIVRISIQKTKYKQIIIILQFPESYPNDPIITELKSKNLSGKLIYGLTNACDLEAKKYLGKPQVMRILKFVRQFLDEKPLCVCSEEISKIKQKLGEEDEIKIIQKTSSVHIKLYKDSYYFRVKLMIPDNYHDEPIGVEEKDSNFPPMFRRRFTGQASEIARQCTEPPLRKKLKDPPFKPKPALLPIFENLVKEVKRYPTEKCLVCNERCLPEDPKNIVIDENDSRHVERVYCGHLYHNECLIKYMKTPPFQGGKKCIGCNNRIYHEKWKISPDLAEARWAHHEAKRRELDEVTYSDESKCRANIKEIYERWIVIPINSEFDGSFISSLNSIPNYHLLLVATEIFKMNLSYHGSTFLDIRQQNSLGYKILNNIPSNGHSRMNIGYLYAIQHGAKQIFEIETSHLENANAIFNDYINEKRYVALVIKTKGIFNPYSHFTSSNILPRITPKESFTK
ncbi:Retrovirus-related Pol polyprotein from type-1 retrotransposable element R2 [Nymphon striatum]|nr:Retrovirus-related Pol polyprotein from type-1 retrotransposable element R2 [Nymphon striatum]